MCKGEKEVLNQKNPNMPLQEVLNFNKTRGLVLSTFHLHMDCVDVMYYKFAERHVLQWTSGSHLAQI